MTKTRLLDGAMFLHMMEAGAARLKENRTIVNDLNVFPIPDGDTGDNMYMTLASGCEAAAKVESDDISVVSAAMSKGMLLGARGNSGVILSRFYSGIAKGLMNISKADLRTYAKALAMGTEEAYQAVLVPVEGTMLTVHRDAVIYATSRLTNDSTFESFAEDFLLEMVASLERTPELLSVLKDAGVVDSGGAGLVYISQGAAESLGGKKRVVMPSEAQKDTPAVDVSLFTEDSELEFGYCTEFLLRLQNSKVDVANFDEKILTDWLYANGESVVGFRDGSIIKVHIHTRTPGKILEHCQQYGEFLTMKIENMTLQHQETTISNRFDVPKPDAPAETPKFAAKPRKLYGVVTVASGKGLIATLKEAGADVVIEGGQTMNPSAQDFVEAFAKVDAKTIFVFPNNSNIVMTAEQAATIYRDRDIRVVPSKSFGAGYVGIASMDMSRKDVTALYQDVCATVAGVTTGMVSRAIRGTMRDGIAVREGDYIAFCNGRVFADSHDRKEVVEELCRATNVDEHDVALLFYGEGVGEEEVASLSSSLEKEFPRTEFIMTDGGQPVFDYIIVLC